LEPHALPLRVPDRGAEQTCRRRRPAGFSGVQPCQVVPERPRRGEAAAVRGERLTESLAGLRERLPGAALFAFMAAQPDETLTDAGKPFVCPEAGEPDAPAGRGAGQDHVSEGVRIA